MELLERSHALDHLEAGLRHAAAGRGRLIAVTGAAGMGKTALVQAFLTSRCTGARVLSGAFDDLTVPRPLGPLVDMAASVGPELATALTGAGSAERLFPLVLEELGRAPLPVVLVLDDLHWADQATLDLLVHVTRRIGQLPALVVMTTRDAGGDQLRRILAGAEAGTTSRLALAPLSVGGVRRVVGDLAEDVHARTGGVPFFVRALQHADGEGVPTSVRDVVLAQANDLPDRARQLLELLSIDPSGTRVSELDGIDPGWEDSAATAEAAGLVTHVGPVVTFSHDLVRQAILEALPAVRRRQLHRRLLDALASDSDAVRVVHHAAGAADDTRLVPAALVAARAARRVHAHQQALAHYELLATRLPADWDHGIRAAVLEELAEEHIAAGQAEAAAHALMRAVEQLQAAGDDLGRGRLLGRWALVVDDVGRRQDARAGLDTAFAALEPHGPSPELAQACIDLALHEVDAWNLRAAAAAGERAVAMATSLGATGVGAYAMMALGTAQALAHEEGGLSLLSAAASTAAEVGDPGLVDLTRCARVEVLLLHHRLDAARATLDHALGEAAVHEHHGIHARLRVQRSRLQMHLGDLRGALATADAAVEEGAGSPVVRWEARLQSAWTRLRLGLPGAASAVAGATRDADQLAIRFRARSAIVTAEAAWLHGRTVDVRLLADAERLARASGQSWTASNLALWQWRHGMLETNGGLAAPFRASVSGDPTAAAAAWRDLGDPYAAALALADSTRPDELLEALEIADGLDARPLGAVLRARLAALGVQQLPRGPVTATRQHPAGLTARQDEVLGHLALGRTNAEIAELLVLSERTVESHVSAILAKLGVRSRGEAVDVARELGLPEDPVPQH